MDYLKIDKNQAKHFIILAAITLLCVSSLNFEDFDFYELNVIQFIMIAYLMLTVLLGLFVAMVVGGIMASLLGTVGIMSPHPILTAVFLVLLIGVSALNIWVLAGYIAKTRKDKKTLREICKVLLYLLGLVIIAVLMVQTGIYA